MSIGAARVAYILFPPLSNPLHFPRLLAPLESRNRINWQEERRSLVSVGKKKKKKKQKDERKVGAVCRLCAGRCRGAGCLPLAIGISDTPPAHTTRLIDSVCVILFFIRWSLSARFSNAAAGH